MKPSDELIEACANQIVDDIINNGDISAIIELLRYCPAEKLVYYLPDDE
jgi:hypothetical protein